MKIGTIGAAVALAMALGGVALAETKPDAFGLDGTKPKPTVSHTVPGEYTLRARVVDAKTGDLAEVVLPGSKVRLELAFTAENGATDHTLRLRCEVSFLDAEARASEFKKAAVCYDDLLSHGAGIYAALEMPITFKPNPQDPSGTSGVKVRITDETTGEAYLLVPTYEWRGGKS